MALKIVGIAVLAYLFLTGVLGLVRKIGRDGLAEGLVAPWMTLGPWFAVGVAFYVGIVPIFVEGFSSVIWWVLGGAGAGILLVPFVLGWDEFYDRYLTGFYASVKREVRGYFSTPIPYFVLLLFVLVCGFFFFVNLKFTRMVSVQPVFNSVSAIGFFLFPLLTMGLFSRELSTGTNEVLMTAPVSDLGVVLSKFLGAMSFFTVMLLPTGLYYFILRHIGSEIGKPDPGPVISAYVGMLLAGGFFISLGLFTSSLTRSQILAALLAWVLIIFFLIAEGISEGLGLGSTWLGDVLRYLDPTRNHLEPFLKGVIDPKDIVFFLSFTAFFLFLSVRAIESRKWR